jgi:NADP-dependent aldehyde dehydrogenase
MQVLGQMLVEGEALHGEGDQIRGIDAATGEPMEPAFRAATLQMLDRVCRAAADAFDAYRETSLETRAALLEAIAANLRAAQPAIVERAMAETGLPRARLEGELGRTCNQLALFAGVLRDGRFLGLRIDPAQPDRTPSPRPDLRLRNIALGPVAVFGASNFPLAFSVAGGDTASALAAGCPVVAKAHNAHPGTSELAGRAIAEAIAEAGLPPGTFALLFDAGTAIGEALVSHAAIKAVGFTGSRAGGLALTRLAQARPEPIPVYAEMSAVNPVVILPTALKNRGGEIAKAFVQALTLGAGQFCTNPGVILAVESEGLDRFVEAAGAAVAQAPSATMLTPKITATYATGVQALTDHAAVEALAIGLPPQTRQGRPALFATSAEIFQGDRRLHQEVFGAASLVVRCPDVLAVKTVLEGMEGQLTIAIHADPEDTEAARAILPVAERRAGRIVFNGFGTGVEVGHAMVHGGPFPSTSDSRYTSVGSLAIRRFLRPVSYQDAPEAILPASLKAANPEALPRLVDGRPET